MGMEGAAGRWRWGGRGRRRRGQRWGWRRAGAKIKAAARGGVLSRWVAVVPPRRALALPARAGGRALAMGSRGAASRAPRAGRVCSHSPSKPQRLICLVYSPATHTAQQHTHRQERSRGHNSLSHTEPRAVATELRGSRTSPPCRCRAPRRAPLLTGVWRAPPHAHTHRHAARRAHTACVPPAAADRWMGAPVLSRPSEGPRSAAAHRTRSPRGLWPKRHLCGGSVFTALRPHRVPLCPSSTSKGVPSRGQCDERGLWEAAGPASRRHGKEAARGRGVRGAEEPRRGAVESWGRARRRREAPGRGSTRRLP